MPFYAVFIQNLIILKLTNYEKKNLSHQQNLAAKPFACRVFVVYNERVGAVLHHQGQSYRW
jgi:hypothetical protein